MIVYKSPKKSLGNHGPLNVIDEDHDTTIARQLTLWDQRGSRVIRGNLLVIPIDQSFLYVEPVFLIAEGMNIPQLKRVCRRRKPPCDGTDVVRLSKSYSVNGPRGD